LVTLLVAATADGLRLALVATTYGFGLRHGVDWDHIAAITDITSSQDTASRSMRFATLYALGHGAVVFVLGTLAIAAGDLLPSGVDSAMERVVGVTLLILGVYVFYALLRHGRDFRMRSRWMLIFSGVARGIRWARRRGELMEIEHDHEHHAGHGHDGVSGPTAAADPHTTVMTWIGHRHPHRHVGAAPDDPFATYGSVTSFGVGMIHGVGAETPTQVLIFLAAARAGGAAAGVFLLVVFIAGLITSNTAIALTSTYGYLNASRSFAVYATVAVLTGAFSLGIGLLFLLGKGTLLPAIFGG
jgi:high-affinity nickel-transport protein